jgi:hypothetical protein
MEGMEGKGWKYSQRRNGGNGIRENEGIGGNGWNGVLRRNPRKGRIKGIWSKWRLKKERMECKYRHGSVREFRCDRVTVIN